jgi:hypothetical protein
VERRRVLQPEDVDVSEDGGAVVEEQDLQLDFYESESAAICVYKLSIGQHKLISFDFFVF